MNYRFYLNRNGLTNVETHVAIPDKLMGLYVKEDGYGHFVEMNIESLTAPIPEIMKYCDRISAKGVILFSHRSEGKRTPGIYSMAGAKLTLLAEQAESSGGHHSTVTGYSHNFTCEGTNFEEVRDIINRVMIGTILPKISHAKPQIKPLPYEFYDWVIAGWRILKRDVLRYKGVF
jgi:hypothetical protein